MDALADAIVGKGGKRIKGRPGTHAAKIKLEDVRAELETKMKKKPTEDDVWSYLMYPDVFLKFAEFRKTYGDVAALPTPAYYYGLQDKEEIHIRPRRRQDPLRPPPQHDRGRRQRPTDRHL